MVLKVLSYFILVHMVVYKRYPNCFYLIFAGVVETGLFVNMAERAFFGCADGSVLEKTVPSSSKTSKQ